MHDVRARSEEAFVTDFVVSCAENRDALRLRDDELVFTFWMLAPESWTVLEEMNRVAHKAQIVFVGEVLRSLEVGMPLRDETESLFFAK